MKRLNNLYNQIISIDNLKLADEKARRGKHDQYGVKIHDRNRTENIQCSGGHWTRQLFHAPERLTIKGNIYENASMLTV
jgi:hypothetical protein